MSTTIITAQQQLPRHKQSPRVISCFCFAVVVVVVVSTLLFIMVIIIIIVIIMIITTISGGEMVMERPKKDQLKDKLENVIQKGTGVCSFCLHVCSCLLLYLCIFDRH